MKYPEIILVSPLDSKSIPRKSESDDTFSGNLIAVTRENNGFHLLDANSCIYIPPYWWFQIKWDKRFKMVHFSLPAPAQLKYIYEH